MQRWHVAETKSNHDALAQANLLTAGFPTLSPRCIELRTKRGKRVEREVPLFEGYLLVQFDYIEDDWEKVSYTKGIRRLITTRLGRPFPIPHSSMRELLSLYGSGPIRENDWLTRFKPKQRVVSTEGLTAGLTGTVDHAARDRVWILFDCLDGGLFRKPIEVRDRALELV